MVNFHNYKIRIVEVTGNFGESSNRNSWKSRNLEYLLASSKVVRMESERNSYFQESPGKLKK